MPSPATFEFWALLGWLLLSFHGTVLTAIAARDAWQDRVWLLGKRLNGSRIVVANAALRNTTARLTLFLSFFIVGLDAFLPRSAAGTPMSALRGGVDAGLIVLALVALAIVAELDGRDRYKLLIALQADVKAVGTAERTHEETLTAIRENTALTREAVSRADASYQAANTINEKIAEIGGNISDRLAGIHGNPPPPEAP